MRFRNLIVVCSAIALALSPSSRLVMAQSPAPAAAFQSAAEILTPMNDDQRDLLQRDFLPAVARETQKQWMPIIPSEARPPVLRKARTFIDFLIAKDGEVKGMVLRGPSGYVALDRAAWGAITGSTYPPLPAAYTQETVRLRLEFFYNTKPQ